MGAPKNTLNEITDCLLELPSCCRLERSRRCRLLRNTRGDSFVSAIISVGVREAYRVAFVLVSHKINCAGIIYCALLYIENN